MQNGGQQNRAEHGLTTVQGSIEFRDLVMAWDRDGCFAYVREHGLITPVYRVVASFDKITADDLFRSEHPPVYMEDIVTALVEAGDDAPKLDLFTLL
ncbi:hypothetical protein [Streptomyces cucumeris]|uniref:hypothetical protein n=1 Tax=Streptomyces cucumeris TaxID=2962890 RepID=UPI0020C8FA13|nr:hypothetical protein [Streptomyces sp. NEAU-Y11]MCP9209638.1 hypothetical protein [Streptomyces sp. NEAU-Y11]